MAEEKLWTREKIKSKIEDNELDLSLCGISKVPVKDMLPFTKITVLDLSCNKINILPDNFTKLVQLVHLDLSKNSLTELPADFGSLSRLVKLDLLNNHLSELPLSFRQFTQLKWLDLKGNPIQENLPSVVGDCLKPLECQQCAKNIVGYYQNLYNENLEREKKAKKREQSRLLKQQKEEDNVRQRRKEEKKRRHEEKKLNNKLKNSQTNNTEEMTNNEKMSQSVSQDVWEDAIEYWTNCVVSSNMSFVLSHVPSRVRQCVSDRLQRGKESNCFGVLCYTVLFLFIVGIIMAVLLKENLNELNSYIDIFIKQARTYLDQLKKAINK
ncbi:leucine-rich repeat-containing protein 59-like isoform X1 [Hydractinia symbiolongicarpus]|uniref:leucine-rich repeat-containing protein 59-like isoform X1 n=1 Tax=Hydractinia symbiolongicarpus TaxID=13093 RepID=UPI00254EF23A|nr:leucine-rich repeat-containing protein 59-like isoform X1 [Hydractinia symbiolongicarpus]